MKTAATMKKTSPASANRSVVVVVLGHVDHGKTSLLDYMRKTKVVARESGGITQHIGAYQVERGDRTITFIDTPGHEAFSAMRHRGARVADIAILVVAADDGIKPQTQEAIQAIQKAKIPFVVALNKIDKPEADTARTKNQLLEENVLLEGYGGDVPSVEVSAHTGQGIDELLDMIVLLSDILDIQAASEEGDVSVVVIESFHDSQKGAGATFLIQNGVLEVGTILAGESAFVKVRAIENYQGERIQHATPGMPCVVYGLSAVARVGDVLLTQQSVRDAERTLKPSSLLSSMNAVPKDTDVIPLIVKTDAQGTLEAVMDVLQQLQKEEVPIHIFFSGVGDVTDSDIRLALSTHAVLVGFRVSTSSSAKTFLRNHPTVTISFFETIYDLSEGVRGIADDTLKPQQQKHVRGRLEVLKVFRAESNRSIIGGRVIDGGIEQGSASVVRDKKQKGDVTIVELRQEQKGITQAKEGMEVGLQVQGAVKIEPGDVVEYLQDA